MNILQSAAPHTWVTHFFFFFFFLSNDRLTTGGGAQQAAETLSLRTAVGFFWLLIFKTCKS